MDKISQEQIFQFFQRMKEECSSLPILNGKFSNYPGILNEDEIYKIRYENLPESENEEEDED